MPRLQLTSATMAIIKCDVGHLIVRHLFGRILNSGFAACSATKIAPSCAPVGAQAQAEGAKVSKNYELIKVRLIRLNPLLKK